MSRRIIPAPQQLVESLQRLHASSANGFDVALGMPLFTKATEDAFHRLISHADRGLLSGKVLHRGGHVHRFVWCVIYGTRLDRHSNSAARLHCLEDFLHERLPTCRRFEVQLRCLAGLSKRSYPLVLFEERTFFCRSGRSEVSRQALLVRCGVVACTLPLSFPLGNSWIAWTHMVRPH